MERLKTGDPATVAGVLETANSVLKRWAYFTPTLHTLVNDSFWSIGVLIMSIDGIGECGRQQRQGYDSLIALNRGGLDCLIYNAI